MRATAPSSATVSSAAARPILPATRSARDRPRSPGSGRAARRPARRQPPARARWRTGGTGADRWRRRPPRVRGVRRSALRSRAGRLRRRRAAPAALRSGPRPAPIAASSNRVREKCGRASQPRYDVGCRNQIRFASTSASRSRSTIQANAGASPGIMSRMAGYSRATTSCSSGCGTSRSDPGTASSKRFQACRKATRLWHRTASSRTVSARADSPVAVAAIMAAAS